MGSVARKMVLVYLGVLDRIQGPGKGEADVGRGCMYHVCTRPLESSSSLREKCNSLVRGTFAMSKFARMTLRT